MNTLTGGAGRIPIPSNERVPVSHVAHLSFPDLTLVELWFFSSIFPPPLFTSPPFLPDASRYSPRLPPCDFVDSCISLM